jgi:hypothetical protein
MEQLCKLLHKNLAESLNSTYSRESWLKNELPKDVLMVCRMKSEIQMEIQNAD